MPSPLERWTDVKALFDEALQRPPTERTDWLGTVCEDEALRAEVERLLVAEAEADTFFGDLGRAVLRDDLDLGTDATDAPPFERAGPYRLLRLVGQGGMGAVYLAERADGAFQRNVAVKLIRRGVTSDEAAVRFRVERQALAGLRHPGIARLLDGGVLADGMPYLAMEYVEGEPITTYCDRQGLGIAARLRLFLEVCAAVEHAHRRLVVHRDLKPSNVLVAEDEAGLPRPVLLDFGLAKMLDDEPGVTVPLTQAGRHALTPHYAAPEQFAGGEITTATDVYALGVLLYELLSGHRPHAAEERGMQAIAEAVREHTPLRPSAVVVRPQDRREAGGETRTVTPEAIGETRTSTPQRLQRRLRGDLDRIVLKALRKEPEQRYVSADALAEDLRRHLGGLPVSARPQTLGYRARSFVRRHRAGVAAAALVVVALVGGLGAALWQADRAEAEAVRATREAATAEAVTSFLTALFASADPDVARGDTLTVVEVLGEGAARATVALADEPAVQGRVLLTVGTALQNLGRYAEADTVLEAALATHRAVYGPDHLATAHAVEGLADLHRLRGNLGTADSLYAWALRVQRATLGPADTVLARTLGKLALVRVHRDGAAAVEPLLRESLAIWQRTHGEAHPRVGEALRNLAVVLEPAEREPLLRRALAVRRATLQPDDLHIAQSASDLAKVLQLRGALGEADSLMRKAHRLYAAQLGPEHPAVLIVQTNRAELLHRQGDLEAAEVLFRDTAAAQRRVYETGNPRLSRTLSLLAEVLLERGSTDEAAALAREAAETLEASLGAGHWMAHDARFTQARAQAAQGRYAEAEPLYLARLARQRAAKSAGIAETRARLAELYEAWGQPQRAAAYYRGED